MGWTPPPLTASTCQSGSFSTRLNQKGRPPCRLRAMSFASITPFPFPRPGCELRSRSPAASAACPALSATSFVTACSQGPRIFTMPASLRSREASKLRYIRTNPVKPAVIVATARTPALSHAIIWALMEEVLARVPVTAGPGHPQSVRGDDHASCGMKRHPGGAGPFEQQFWCHEVADHAHQSNRQDGKGQGDLCDCLRPTGDVVRHHQDEADQEERQRCIGAIRPGRVLP